MTHSQSITRLKVVISIIIFVALVLGARLYVVQIVHGEVYSNEADRQYVRPEGNVFDRGSIYFRDRQISAATLKSGYTLAISPAAISNPEDVYEQLSSIVDIDEETFFLRAGKTDDPYEEVAHQIPEAAAEKIGQLQLEGVGLYEEKWRYYPGNHLASRVIGFVGFNGDAREGRYGVERFYEPILERSGDSLYVNFFAQVFSGIRETVIHNQKKRSGDVVLTIDPTVQASLQETLTSTRKKWGTEKTMGIIINPKTGDIYAMGTAPSFNLNTFSEVNDPSLYSNPLVENVYEMGSIIKPITVAIGLETDAVTPETTFEDTGSVKIDGATISNYDGEARGVVDMQEVLNQSLNTGAAFVAQEIGNSTFRKYLYRFGVNEKTNIDLPSEARPLVNNLESPRDIEYVTASFGQGIAMTPVATVRALSVLANGGKLITPHVGKEVEYELGFSKDLFPNPVESGQAISPKTSDEITRMLVTVVDEALKNGEVKLDRYSVAAKTGTAQVAKPNESGYYENVFNHSFFGYFPAYDPEYLVFLMNIRPKGAKYASETLTEPFMDIVKFLINYYEVPPDREKPSVQELSE